MTISATPSFNGRIILVNKQSKTGEVKKVIQEKGEIKNPKALPDIPEQYIDGNTVNWKAFRKDIADSEAKQKLPELQENLSEYRKNKDYQAVLNYFGIETKENEDGSLTLSRYSQPEKGITFEMLGIDENEMFQNVSEIEGDGDFLNSSLKSLYNCKKIGGNVRCSTSKLETLGGLVEVGGNLNLEHSDVKSLGDLEYVGGGANFKGSKNTSTDNLKHIGKNALFAYSKIKDISGLEYIGGKISFYNSKLIKEDFKDIEKPE